MAVIDDIYIQAVPFPCILLSTEGQMTPSGGALFPAPPRTADEAQLLFYWNCKTGWHVCPLGYAIYSFVLIPERGTRLVLFGLKVKGVSTIHGKSDVLSINLSKDYVESFSRRIISSVEEIEARLQSIVSSGVHEFRNVNKDLYNTAYQLEHELSSTSLITGVHVEIARSIVQLSEMMKSRSDIFDVITNPSIARIRDQNIHVYRAFDRARKSILLSSASRKVTLKIGGSSNSQAQAVQMFDVVPYILLQNAVKYSPNGEDVQITVLEKDNYILATIESWGPALHDEELLRIFSPGFRGKLAEAFESQGSGMGLFVVKRLIDFCEGASVELKQIGEKRAVQNIEFKRTKCELKLRKTNIPLGGSGEGRVHLTTFTAPATR